MNARHLAWVIGCATAIAAAPAWAEFKYSFSSGYSNCLGPATYGGNCAFGNTRNASSVTGGPGPLPATTSVTAQAWSNTAGTGAGDLQTAYLPTWGASGLGVQNRDMANIPNPAPGLLGDGQDSTEASSPEHAMDNSDRYDSIVFAFGGLGFKLTGVEIGWSSNDSDIFVLASNVPIPVNSTGTSTLNYDDLTSSGWTLIGNYSNLPVNSKVDVNASGVTANYWLIGTGCYTGSGIGVSLCGKGYTDHVKLLALYGEPSHDHKVPEPATALLFGVAALAGWRVRRKRLELDS
jgi:hypothetical protein